MLVSKRTQDRYEEAKQERTEAQARYSAEVMQYRYYAEWGQITDAEYERQAKRVARETGLTAAEKALRKAEDAVLSEMMVNAKKYGLPAEDLETLKARTGDHYHAGDYRAYRARMLQIGLAH